MKKIILSWAMVLCFGMLSAQNTPPQPPQQQDPARKDQQTTNPAITSPQQQINVPADVTRRFEVDHPDTRTTWSMNGINYRAEYMDRNANIGRSVIYDNTGKPLFTERELRNGEYPVTISDYFSSSYPGQTFKVWSSQDDAGAPTYYIPYNSEILLFDEQGNFLSKTTRIEPMQ